MEETMSELELLNELENFKGQWFVINCNSGHEEKIREDLIEKMNTGILSQYIFDIRISKAPIAGKNGKVMDRNKFPGYIFINMIITDETWFTIRNTPGVTGFIGSSGKGAKPLPLTTDEVMKMLMIGETKEEKVTPGQTPKKEKNLFKAEFAEKDFVIITNGVFGGKEGQVMKMDYEKGIAIINIELFGRYTPSEVNFDDAKKLNY
jgi:transcriptional antiterminator NusG